MWRDNFALTDREKRTRKAAAAAVTVLPSKAVTCTTVQISPSDIVGYRHAGGFTPAYLRLRVRPSHQQQLLVGHGRGRGAAAKRIRRRPNAYGDVGGGRLEMRLVCDGTDGRCRPKPRPRVAVGCRLAAAPTLMWVVARWGARHARDRRLEPSLRHPGPSHVVGAPTRQPRHDVRRRPRFGRIAANSFAARGGGGRGREILPC